MIPPANPKHIALVGLALTIIAFLTQSIIATHHAGNAGAQFDEEEIIDLFANASHETNSSAPPNQGAGLVSAGEPVVGVEKVAAKGAGELSLFAWRQLPTNRCSKRCGRGFRLHHLSCIDLKYNVRVEEKFCQEETNLLKPEELSDEPCNELDCPPEWASIEYRECSPPEVSNSPNTDNKLCQLNVYKRVQCMMVDRSGKSIQLPDSSCNTTNLNHTQQTAAKDAHSSQGSQTSGDLDEQDVEIILDEDEQQQQPEGSNERSNDISPANRDRDDDEINYLYLHDAPSSSPSAASAATSNTLTPIVSSQSEEGEKSSARRLTNNEPFYELGTWSECSGAACGQLGKRIRMVSCRLYLVKSTKFVELPVSSCQHLPAPDVQEPCYLDCVPPSQPPLEQQQQQLSDQAHHHHEQHKHRHLHHPEKKNHHDISGLAQLIENNEQNMNETISDLEMMRYTWKMIKQKLKLIQY